MPLTGRKAREYREIPGFKKSCDKKGGYPTPAGLKENINTGKEIGGPLLVEQFTKGVLGKLKHF